MNWGDAPLDMLLTNWEKLLGGLIINGSTSYRDDTIVVVKFLGKAWSRAESLDFRRADPGEQLGVPWLVQPGEEKVEQRPKSSPETPTRRTWSQTLYRGAQQDKERQQSN